MNSKRQQDQLTNYRYVQRASIKGKCLFIFFRFLPERRARRNVKEVVNRLRFQHIPVLGHDRCSSGKLTIARRANKNTVQRTSRVPQIQCRNTRITMDSFFANLLKLYFFIFSSKGVQFSSIY